MAGLNSRWRKGVQRALPNRKVDHPSVQESWTEATYIQNRAREREGWSKAARVVRRELNKEI